MNALPVTDRAFAALQELMRTRTGFVLEDDKKYLVEMRLAPLLRRLERGSYEELLAGMHARGTVVSEQMIVDAMLNGETTFFRDISCFQALERVVVPEIIRRRASTRRIRIWCAAASTGQEPYSLAMMLARSFPELESWDVGIHGTDYSAHHLERAREARYSQFEVNRGLPARMLVTHFTQEGHSWVVRPEIRRRVTFAPMNLVSEWPAMERADLVLLRNVMIYWEAATQRRVLGRVGDLIGREGFLVLGGAETTFFLDSRFEAYGPGGGCCYALR